MKIIISFIMVLLLPSLAIAKDFRYTEVNAYIKKGNVTIGTRGYFDKDYSQGLLRYDFTNSPNRVEYRYVQNGDNHEHRLRYQRKWFNVNGFWYNHRIEHRIRENKNNILRYRPQFGYAPDNIKFLGGSPFITFEPHWNHTYKNDQAEYNQMQTWIGLEYKITKKLTMIPSIETGYNTKFQKQDTFAIIDFKYNMGK